MNGEELWKLPPMKMVVKDGVELKKAITVRGVSGACRPNATELEKALRGESLTWKVYAVETRGANRSLVKLVSCIEEQRWARRGQFMSGVWYDKAEAEIVLADSGSATWKKVISEQILERAKPIDVVRGTLPRAAIPVAVSA